MKFFSFLKYTPFSETSQRNHLMTASGRGHRRRSIRFPAAKDRALQGFKQAVVGFKQAVVGLGEDTMRARKWGFPFPGSNRNI